MDDVKVTDAAGALTRHTKTSFQLDAAGYVISETTENILEGTQGSATFITSNKYIFQQSHSLIMVNSFFVM